MTASATLVEHLPSKQQVQRTASEFAVSLALELLVLGVVRRRRKGRRTGRPHEHREHREHRFLRAVAAEVAAESATELSTKRRRMMYDLERRLDEQMVAARKHS
jgi:hypothetical protein